MKPWLDRIETARPQIALAALGIGVGAALLVWVGFAIGRHDFDYTAAFVMIGALAVWLFARKPRS